MHSFFDLVGFEYKKIFKRKGAILALTIVTILSFFLPISTLIGGFYHDGELIESYHQGMLTDREHARALAGRSVDEMLIEEVRVAYSRIPYIESGVSFVTIPEYREYARPYRQVYHILQFVYGNQFRLMRNISSEQIENFYQIRHKNIENSINSMNISDASKNNLIKLDSQIKTPFIFDDISAYDYFFSGLHTIGIIGAFAIAVCLAPIFSGEYTTRIDQQMLSSRYGKNKIILAKLCTGISLCVGFSLMIIFFIYSTCSIVFGIGSTNVPIQLWYPLSIYPITILQAAILHSLCVFFATILLGAITMFLSSIFKSPFGVIIIVTLLLFVPMMINIPDDSILIANLLKLFPNNMMWVAITLVNYQPYELFGFSIAPYIFFPVFSATLSAILLPLSYISFKNHQVN